MVPLTEVLDESLQSQGKPNEGEIRVSCPDISYLRISEFLSLQEVFQM